MGTSTEIERKFLLEDDSWVNQVTEMSEIEQHYLLSTPTSNVRVRMKQKGDKTSYLHTIKEKSPLHEGSKEIENEISEDTFSGLKQISIGSIFKTRYIIPAGDYKWEIDVFSGNLEGLVMAEIEIPSFDTKIELPSFIGKEVTNDKRYSNANLCMDCNIEDDPEKVLENADKDDNSTKECLKKL